MNWKTVERKKAQLYITIIIIMDITLDKQDLSLSLSLDIRTIFTNITVNRNNV